MGQEELDQNAQQHALSMRVRPVCVVHSMLICCAMQCVAL